MRDNRPHRHQALQLTWAADGAALRMAVDGHEVVGRCVLVDGGVTHQLRLEAGVIALVDAASPMAARLRSRHLDDGDPPRRWAVLAAPSFETGAGPSETLAETLVETAVGADVVGDELGELDERVVRVLAWLDEMEQAGRWHEVNLDGALRRAHLSSDRFRHLFSEALGSPWRTYLVWRRALVAMTLTARGASLTEAAHAAGYADSAHLSRQFVALFGVTPAAFARVSHFVQV